MAAKYNIRVARNIAARTYNISTYLTFTNKYDFKWRAIKYENVKSVYNDVSRDLIAARRNSFHHTRGGALSDVSGRLYLH